MPLSESDQLVLKRLGAAIRRERRAKGMTQEQMAELTDLHLRTVQKIESASINVLVTTVHRIQKVIGCSWDSLMR